MFEVLYRESGLSFIYPMLSDALLAATPDSEVWQLAETAEDDGFTDRTRILLVCPQGGVKPGMRMVNGEWFYSSRWL